MTRDRVPCDLAKDTAEVMRRDDERRASSGSERSLPAASSSRTPSASARRARIVTGRPDATRPASANSSTLAVQPDRPLEQRMLVRACSRG